MFYLSIILLTETWLTYNISNYELGLLIYNIFRYDKCISTSNFSRDGRVLIGIRKDISAWSIAVTQINVEHIFVHFSLDSFNFIVGGAYISPHSSSLLNLPEITWAIDDNSSSSFSSMSTL